MNKIYKSDVQKLRQQLAECQKERDEHIRNWNRVVDELNLLRTQVRGLRLQRDELQGEYDSLIFAVGNKWPNETRHQTALRYIRAMENQANASVAKLGNGEEK